MLWMNDMNASEGLIFAYLCGILKLLIGPQDLGTAYHPPMNSLTRVKSQGLEESNFPSMSVHPLFGRVYVN